MDGVKLNHLICALLVVGWREDGYVCCTTSTDSISVTTETLLPTASTQLPASTLSYIEKFKLSFGITNTSTPVYYTIGRSVSYGEKIKYGIYTHNATWFTANATCTTEGYSQLAQHYKSWWKFRAVKRTILREISDRISSDFWTGYIRTDPCNDIWKNSSCVNLTNYEHFVENAVTLKERQCATVKFETNKAFTAQLCDDLNPFICEVSLGDVTYYKVNLSSVLIADGLSVHYWNVSLKRHRTEISTCKSLCSARMRCNAFSFHHENNSCWFHISNTNEIIYGVYEVEANVTSYMKEGYQVEINNISSVQNASAEFTCQPNITYTYTRNYTSQCPVSVNTGTITNLSSPLTMATVGITGSSTMPSQSASTQSPTDSTPSPSVSTPSPSVTSPSPSVSTPSPSVSTPSPSVSTPSPSVSTPSPSVSTPSPSASPAMSSQAVMVTTEGTVSSVTSSSSSSSSALSHSAKMCKCPCSQFIEIKNMNRPVTSEAIQEIIRKTKIPPRQTGKFQRKLKCSEDNRPTSLQVGSVSIGIMVCIFGGLFLYDILGPLQKLFGYFRT